MIGTLSRLQYCTAVLLLLALPFCAQSKRFDIHPGSDVVGHVLTVTAQPGDSLTKIAKRYDIGIAELYEANKDHRFRILKVGQSVVIPNQFVLPPPRYRQGIVINIAELRLYYFPADAPGHVMTFPVALGRAGWRTPTMITRIIKKERDPVWHVPKSIQAHMFEEKGVLLPNVVKAGPKNPLGAYAMYLAKPGYLIHGTNNPSSIGRWVSSGCIRLYPKDIETLFDLVPDGTRVAIIHHPLKMGWHSHQLYIEAHPPVELDEAPNAHNTTPLSDVFDEATRNNRDLDVNWGHLYQAEEESTGVPVVIDTDHRPNDFSYDAPPTHND